MSAEEKSTSFERWALLGAAALAAVGFAAFYSRHDTPTSESEQDALSRDADLLSVRIGGNRSERPPIPPRGPAATPPVPEDPQHEVNNDPPPNEVPRRPAAERTVVVQAGETLGGIVQRELGTVSRLDEVIRLNGIENADDVRAGTILRMPPE